MKKLLRITAIILLMVLMSCQETIDTSRQSNSNTITLSDGRHLSYTVNGPEEAASVFYFHGFPGSHMDIELFKGADLAQKHNIRLIAVDRPGYGSSDPCEERSLLDWPEDLVELADFLEIDTFSILGFSGGGPFVLACAYAIPERISHVAIVSGMGPWDAPESKNGMAMTIPRAPKLILKGMANTLFK